MNAIDIQAEREASASDRMRGARVPRIPHRLRRQGTGVPVRERQRRTKRRVPKSLCMPLPCELAAVQAGLALMGLAEVFGQGE
jgi:hypothetical protein